MNEMDELERMMGESFESATDRVYEEIKLQCDKHDCCFLGIFYRPALGPREYISVPMVVGDPILLDGMSKLLGDLAMEGAMQVSEGIGRAAFTEPEE